MSNEETTQGDGGMWAGRLTPSDVHNVLFSRAGLGRRGYDEGEVDFFLERAQNELVRLIGEKSVLREDVDRLRSQLAAAGGQGQTGPRRDEASAQAVRILSAAQQTADQYVAEAENYSKRLTTEAREHCDAMIEEARARGQAIFDAAEQAAAEAAERISVAPEQAGDDASEEIETAQAKQELEEQVSYLRTFSEVCRVQLRAYLEALLRDIEDEWGRATPDVLASMPRDRFAASIPSPAEPDDDLVDLTKDESAEVSAEQPTAVAG